MPKVEEKEINDTFRACIPKKSSMNHSQILDDSLSVSEINRSSIIDNRQADVTLLDPLFDKWFIDQEALNGVLNVKVTKDKNE